MITAVVYYCLGGLFAIEVLKDHTITEWLRLVGTSAQTGPFTASFPVL